MPGVVETVNLDDIVRHYYRSHGDVDPERPGPVGPDVDFDEPHVRDRLPGAPAAALAPTA